MGIRRGYRNTDFRNSSKQFEGSKKMNEPIATPASYPSIKKKGGPGQYDGEKGYPPRTKSPNSAPEKIRDGNVGGGNPGSHKY